MPGQGVIGPAWGPRVPAGFGDRRPRMLAELGVGKTVTVRRPTTIGYPGRRVGLFLAQCRVPDGQARVLRRGFGPSASPTSRHVAAGRQLGRGGLRRGNERLIKQANVQTWSNIVPGSEAPDRPPRPARCEPVDLHPELDPLHYGLTIWDLPRSSWPTAWPASEMAHPREILSVLRARLLPHLRRRVHAHPGPGAEALDPAARRGSCPAATVPTE